MKTLIYLVLFTWLTFSIESKIIKFQSQNFIKNKIQFYEKNYIATYIGRNYIITENGTKLVVPANFITKSFGEGKFLIKLFYLNGKLEQIKIIELK